MTEQTAPEVQAHIEALKRDRALTRRTLDAVMMTIRAMEAQIAGLDIEFHNAQRTLDDVSASVGPVREQIIRAAANLAAQERSIERLDATAAEIDEIQTAINAWLEDAKAARILDGASTDIDRRTSVFTRAFGQYLRALGHSAAIAYGVDTLRLDQGKYEPYLGHRRLRALGSGSDPARLVGAYSLALAGASATLNGLHPGIVILDEPLQQNPDTVHRKLFLDFLSKSHAKESAFQTLVFTFLNESEVEKLRDNGASVITVEGHLLGPVPEPPNGKAPN